MNSRMPAIRHLPRHVLPSLPPAALALAVAALASACTSSLLEPCTRTGRCPSELTCQNGVCVPMPRLEVRVEGSGKGRVTSPAGIQCPDQCELTLHPTQVELTAEPELSRFDGWSGGGCSGTGTCTVQVSEETVVSAHFTAFVPLTVTLEGIGFGFVRSTGGELYCVSGSCSVSLPPGTTVTLEATPAYDATFVGWTSGCSGTAPCSVTLEETLTVTARFEPIAPRFTAHSELVTSVAPGETVRFWVVAEDRLGDPLVFQWGVSTGGGTWGPPSDGPSSSSREWTAPTCPTPNEITRVVVTARKRDNPSALSSSLSFEARLPPGCAR